MKTPERPTRVRLADKHAMFAQALAGTFVIRYPTGRVPQNLFSNGFRAKFGENPFHAVSILVNGCGRRLRPA